MIGVMFPAFILVAHTDRKAPNIRARFFGRNARDIGFARHRLKRKRDNRKRGER